MQNKMQQADFRNVGEFLDFLPDNERHTTALLREIVLDCLHGCKEKLSFNVPFYYSISRTVCFIWPASVLWGKTKTYQGVRLGFNYGILLKDEANYLDIGNRKQVGYKDFLDAGEVEEAFLRTYLYEAAAIDAGFSKTRRKQPVMEYNGKK